MWSAFRNMKKAGGLWEPPSQDCDFDDNGPFPLPIPHSPLPHITLTPPSTTPLPGHRHLINNLLLQRVRRVGRNHSLGR